MPVIEVDGLTKRYSGLVAVDDVSLSVEEGEVFGLLGPNGAGKTTLVECIEGLRVPDAGRVSVLGLDAGGAVAPSANAAIAIGLLAFFGTMVLGGGFAPRENLPDVLARVGEHTPFGAALDALSASWAGQAPTVAQTVALALTTLVAGALAARLFRWE